MDVLLDAFGSQWPEIRDAARAAELAGLDGVWLNDHLAGSTERAPHVLECWTVLSALADAVPGIAIGPLVINVANRDPGTLAVMASTLQHVSGGRLLLGLGAGARAGSVYAVEQEALGRPVPGDAARRAAVERTISVLRQVWSGSVPPAEGFLRPEPAPPVVVAASGPKMAEVAGRMGDGICVPGGQRLARLVAIARRARGAAGRDPVGLLVTASLATMPPDLQPWVALGVDRLIVSVGRPFEPGVAQLGQLVRRTAPPPRRKAARGWPVWGCMMGT